MKITLCGSARFEEWFKFWNEQLSLAGHCVYTLSVYPSQKEAGKDWYDEDQKRVLDQVHFDKIENSDAIFVINAFAYIGESTLREIEYASRLGKTIYALESWGVGNGIGHSHNTEYQNAARKYGCFGKGSPINTTSPEMKNIYNGDEILGGYGKLRSSVCNAKDEFMESIIWNA